MLLNARHLHNVPGRKRDVADVAWICQLVEHGLVRPSFVPPLEIRELRDLTRYRKALIQERTREAQRLEKTLQDAGIKLSSVASDILGASGRAMVTALVEGTHDPEVLASLAKGVLRRKLPQLAEALQAHFRTHHALIASEILAHIDYLDVALTSWTSTRVLPSCTPDSSRRGSSSDRTTNRSRCLKVPGGIGGGRRADS